MIKLTSRGSFKNTFDFAKRMKSRQQFRQLAKYGSIGVTALSNATPEDTGETGESWYYEIEDKPGHFAIHWLNSNMEEGVSIAAIIQYGHATGNGAYIQGVDYINPVMRPIFDRMADDMWKEVTK